MESGKPYPSLGACTVPPLGDRSAHLFFSILHIHASFPNDALFRIYAINVNAKLSDQAQVVNGS